MHLTPLDDRGLRAGEDLILSGRSLHGLVADAAGGATLLLARPDELFLVRAAADGTVLVNKRLVGGGPRDDPQARWIGEGNFEGGLAWTGQAYTALFRYQWGQTTVNRSHNMLRLFEPDGWTVSPGAEGHYPAWQYNACTTPFDLRLAYNASSDQVAPVCLSDRLGGAPGMYFGRGAFRRREILRIGPAMELNPDGSVAGELGGLIALEDGFALSYAATLRRVTDIHLVRISPDGQTTLDVPLTRSGNLRESAPHLARYGPDLLAAWIAFDGRLTINLVDGTGLTRAGGDPAPLDALIEPKDAFVNLADGAVAWTYVAADRSQLIHARIPYCPLNPVAK